MRVTGVDSVDCRMRGLRRKGLSFASGREELFRCEQTGRTALPARFAPDSLHSRPASWHASGKHLLRRPGCNVKPTLTLHSPASPLLARIANGPRPEIPPNPQWAPFKIFRGTRCAFGGFFEARNRAQRAMAVKSGRIFPPNPQWAPPGFPSGRRCALGEIWGDENCMQRQGRFRVAWNAGRYWTSMIVWSAI